MKFSFNDIMSAKMDGNSMGSPLGHILAIFFVGFTKNFSLKMPQDLRLLSLC